MDKPQQSSPSHPPRRRNGLRGACEPCRRRKLACDHILPICGRCQRRGAGSNCIYEGSAARLQSPSIHRVQPPSPPLSAGGGGRRPNHVRANSAPRDLIQHRFASPGSLRPTVVEASPESNETGYLGPTSFSIFLQETQNSLSHLQGRTGVPESSSKPTTPTPWEANSILLDSSKSQRTWNSEIALHVLKCIPDRTMASILLQKDFNPNDGWIRAASSHMVTALWDTFGSVLDGTRDDSQLLQIAQTIQQNASHHLLEDQIDAKEWLASFSGSNLRWEALGILFAYWAAGTESLPDDDVYCNLASIPRLNKAGLFSKYHECICLCLQLCGRPRVGNTLLLFLLLKNSMLFNISHGDASLASWSTVAEAVSVTTHLGLHVIPPNAADEFSITSQVKRRLFALTYQADKTAASFTGRPPLLSHRYCSTPLPLDLSEETLLDSNVSPSVWYTSLDKDGWNVDNKIYSSTVLRARTSMSIIRDEILEMTLGINQGIFIDRLLDLKGRQVELYSRLPSAILYQPADGPNQSLDGRTLYSRILVRLEHQQNILFLLRLLLKARRQQADSIELLGNSFETLSVSLVLWTRRDTLNSLKLDFDWMIVSYACPAAGVLCIELLKPDSILHSGKSSLKRSDVIQNLSLFVGFLDWITSCGCAGATSTICTSVRQVVQGVLDHVLNSPAQVPVGSGAQDLPVPMWDMEMPDELNDVFGFELLDTFDWLRAQ